MKIAHLLERARRTANSAKLLLDAGDMRSACNRVYYAMFDAARAALLADADNAKPDGIKTHAGIVSAFSLHLIKPGLLPVNLGKDLSRVDQIRLAADYSDEDIDQDTAARAVQQAQAFVDAIGEYLRL